VRGASSPHQPDSPSPTRHACQAGSRFNALSKKPDMNPPPCPTQHLDVFQRLNLHDRVSRRAGPASIPEAEGHRIVIELERFARALGIEPDELECLRRDGFIDLAD